MKLLLEIVFTFMQISILSFGGGYASMSLVEKQIVTIKHWMTYKEFSDIVTIDELTPGPVAINAATFVGIKMAGIPGAIAATIGAILPPCIIAFIMVKLYYRYRKMKAVNGALSGLRCMAVAMVISTTISIFLNALINNEVKSIDYIFLLLFSFAFFILRKYKPNPLLIMFICGIIGLIIYPLFS